MSPSVVLIKATSFEFAPPLSCLMSDLVSACLVSSFLSSAASARQTPKVKVKVQSHFNDFIRAGNLPQVRSNVTSGIEPVKSEAQVLHDASCKILPTSDLRMHKYADVSDLVR